jgi:uncharacterized membrane protein (DUF2068 family)
LRWSGSSASWSSPPRPTECGGSSHDRADIQRAFNHDLPTIRALYQHLSFNVNHSKLLGLIQHSFTLDARTLTCPAIGLAVNALIELTEGVGLWLGQRWGEYFAMVATSSYTSANALP